MKKIFFVGILSILLVGASYAQARIGVTAGLNASNITAKADGISVSADYKAGFQAGLVADFGITESFSIMPELLFSQRGSKYKEFDSSLTLNYLQLPVNATYKFDTGMGSQVFIFAGPYIGYALSGKQKSDDISEDVEFGSGDGEMKRLDFGLNVGAGFQYEKLFFKLQFNPGLYNLSNEKDYSTKNTNVAVTVGYYIN